jgi:hypothetical protein
LQDGGRGFPEEQGPVVLNSKRHSQSEPEPDIPPGAPAGGAQVARGTRARHPLGLGLGPARGRDAVAGREARLCPSERAGRHRTNPHFVAVALPQDELLRRRSHHCVEPLLFGFHFCGGGGGRNLVRLTRGVGAPSRRCPGQAHQHQCMQLGYTGKAMWPASQWCPEAGSRGSKHPRRGDAK